MELGFWSKSEGPNLKSDIKCITLTWAVKILKNALLVPREQRLVRELSTTVLIELTMPSSWAHASWSDLGAAAPSIVVFARHQPAEMATVVYLLPVEANPCFDMLNAPESCCYETSCII